MRKKKTKKNGGMLSIEGGGGGGGREVLRSPTHTSGRLLRLTIIGPGQLK